MIIKRYCLTILLAAMLLTAAGCQVGAAPLSPKQLQEYIQANHIHPSLIENVGDVTVILVKTPTELGCYTVWARLGIEADLTRSYLTGMQGNTTLQPITAVRNSAFRDDIVCVTINDPAILRQAESLRIVFFDDKNQLVVPIRNQESMIIHRESNTVPKRVEITIYDKNQAELNKSSFFN